MSESVHNLRLPRPPGSAVLTITVDGEPVSAYPGETVATVLLAAGRRTFRHTDRFATPRGLFCGMGICYDCLVTVDGQPDVRACMTTVQPGMTVETNRRPSSWVSEQGQQEEPHLITNTGEPSDARIG